MLARTRKIKHPLGPILETPLLIPSFSSKGFGFNKNKKSEIGNIFSLASEYLTDTMLLSAYDLHYEHIPQVEGAITEITFVDSGGYEVSSEHDLSTVHRQPSPQNDWTEDNLRAILNVWPEHVPAVFVNFDHPDIRISLEQQIESAKKFLSNYQGQLRTLLIKPETKAQAYVQIKNVIANVDDLQWFDIIGFTEKELGSSVLDRMAAIASIRLQMDDSGIDAPIHVYGSLDPITSVLYFLSGAELFDGLTWLRYGYANGEACYVHNYGVRHIGIDRKHEFIVAKTIRDNLGYLIDLMHQMRTFLLDKNFSAFGKNEDILSKSYSLLRTKNKRIQL